jgi:heme/copper-type cytochrome/quinol oxidase subunit 2
MMKEAEDSEGNLGICLVMGGKATKEYSYEHEGKTYYFCCPGCIGTFKADPKKYISKIKEFHFEAYQFGYSPEEIEVKKGDIVKIYATSRDVPHGIYIKEYDINVVVEKGKTKKIEFLADKLGEFQILCSIYCGRGHHDMRATLVVKE